MASRSAILIKALDSILLTNFAGPVGVLLLKNCCELRLGIDCFSSRGLLVVRCIIDAYMEYKVIAGWVMTDISGKYVLPNLRGAGLQYIPHYGIWHLLSIYHIAQAIVSLPQVTSYNIKNSSFPRTKDHSAGSSVFSGMRLYLSPVHILIENSNTYVIYVPMTLWQRTSPTKLCTA